MKGGARAGLLLILLCCSPLPVLAAAVDRLLVAFEPGVVPAEVIRELPPISGVALAPGPRLGRAFILRLSPPLDMGAARRLAARLAGAPGVRYAEVPPRFKPHFVPSDPRYGSQWNLWDSYGIRAPEAWDIERGEPDLVIAALDTGILAHEDLDAGRVLPGYDFISDPASAGDGDGRDPDPSDPGDGRLEGDCPGEAPSNSSWHGLQIAGVLLATVDNGLGIAGINHRSRLLPVRVLGKCGGDFVDVAFAMLWAAGLEVTGVPDNPNPARVLNLSFGGPGACTPAVQDIVDQVLATGAVIVAAAGNGNGADVADSVPAGCTGVITVAATTRSGSLASYSNKGRGVALSAPAGGNGEGVLSLSNRGVLLPDADSYAAYNGTSLAAAQVSAAVSLLLSYSPGLSADQVLGLLQTTARPFPEGGGCDQGACGAGILDVAAALQEAPVIAAAASAAPEPASGGGGGGCVMTGQTGDLSWGMSIFWPFLLRRKCIGRHGAGR